MEVAMLERFFLKPQTVDRIMGCWLGPEIELYVTVLLKQGYSTRSILRRVPILTEFAKFAEARNVNQIEQAEALIDAFVVDWVSAGLLDPQHPWAGPHLDGVREVRGSPQCQPDRTGGSAHRRVRRRLGICTAHGPASRGAAARAKLRPRHRPAFLQSGHIEVRVPPYQEFVGRSLCCAGPWVLRVSSRRARPSFEFHSPLPALPAPVRTLSRSGGMPRPRSAGIARGYRIRHHDGTGVRFPGDGVSCQYAAGFPSICEPRRRSTTRLQQAD